ncbi:hypothetical protein [Lysobacter xanthus]
MVRNPRTVMMCGLLVLAMGMALGSRVAPGPDVTATPAPGPWLLEQVFGSPKSMRPAPVAATPIDVAASADAPGLEGHRHPRGPRSPRDVERLAR